MFGDGSMYNTIYFHYTISDAYAAVYENQAYH
jgi:hypothetical protein